MVKKILILSLISAAFSVWAGANKMQEVDGTSSATIHNNLKFNTPINVTADSATITWTIGKGATGNHVISWGKVSADMTSRDVTSGERSSKTVKLSGLSPNTAYKIRLEVTHPQNMKGPCADTATITTKPATVALNRFITNNSVCIELLDHSVRLGSMAKNGDHLTVTDCKGRALLNHKVKSNENAINLPSNAKGVYFLIYSRQGTVLDKKQFVITHK